MNGAIESKTVGNSIGSVVVKDLRLEDKIKDKNLRLEDKGQGLVNFSMILEDKDFSRGQQQHWVTVKPGRPTNATN